MSSLKGIGEKFFRAKIIHTIGWVSVLYAVNIVLAILRDAFLSARFGASEQLDALLLGINLIRTASLFIVMAVSGGMIPTFAVLLDQKKNRNLGTYIWKANIQLFVVLVILAVFTAVFNQEISRLLGPGLSTAAQEDLAAILLILTPILVILGLAGINKALGDSLASFEIHPVLLGMMTLGTIIGLLVFRTIFGVAVGLVVGTCLAYGFQIFRLIRLLKEKIQLDILALRKGFLRQDQKINYSPIIFLLLGGFAIQGQGLIERAFSTSYGPGSVTALSLAISIVAVPATLLVPAMTSVMLPYLSRKEYSASRQEFGLPFKNYLLIGAACLMVTAVYWVASDFLVRLLFQRGNFTAEAAATTAVLVRILSLGFLPYVLMSIFRQVLIARKQTLVDMLISAVVFIIKFGILWFWAHRYQIQFITFTILFGYLLNLMLYVVVINMNSRNRLKV
ncbi:MAG: lipid II flippase MurJ [Ardenticatenaceae bacterium]|nr:lipid II flippase MurJ [Ardenticatenaceae bacterium]